jgi:hypothetical protein
MTVNEIRALKIDVENGLYTINEVRERLGESKVADAEADQLLMLNKKAGWLHLDNTAVKVRVEALLPKAFARLGTAEGEPEHRV